MTQKHTIKNISKEDWEEIIKKYKKLENLSFNALNKAIKEMPGFNDWYSDSHETRQLNKKFQKYYDDKIEIFWEKQQEILKTLDHELFCIVITSSEELEKIESFNFIEKYRKFHFDYGKNSRKLKTSFGLNVCSKGEKKIAEFLHNNKIDFVYDQVTSFYKYAGVNKFWTELKIISKDELMKRFVPFSKAKGCIIHSAYHINEGFFKLRPDFILYDHRIIIEYYGLVGQEDYDKKIIMKRDTYMRNHYYLIEIYPKDLQNIEEILTSKLLNVPYSLIENKKILKTLLSKNKLKRKY